MLQFIYWVRITENKLKLVWLRLSYGWTTVSAAFALQWWLNNMRNKFISFIEMDKRGIEKYLHYFVMVHFDDRLIDAVLTIIFAMKFTIN